MAAALNGDCCTNQLKGTLVLPVPVYPSAVVTDESLKIASNEVETTLVGRVSSGDTIFRVSDTSRLTVHMLLSTDNEIVSIAAIEPGNVIAVVRGFDGTIPAAHNAGSVLRAYIAAWHHNALAAEIKAIEDFLGPNGQNLNPSSETIFYLAGKYNFGPQIPGGTLNTGSNVITLSPVPAGVNAANSDYRVYISGGTGAAEAALVTGGTAVAGAESGTLIVTCAGSHSGAWTISSASGGIQEAICAMPVAGGVALVTQDVTLHAHVSNAGRTQPRVWKLAGVSVSGSFDVLEYAGPDPTLTEYVTGPQSISANLGSFNNRVAALSVLPEAHDPFPPTYGIGIAVGQSNPAKIDLNQFFHGVAVDIHTNNPGPTNQNAAVLGFIYSHGGADPFGADFHAIVPDAATAAPTYAIGVQAETQVNIPAPASTVYPMLLIHRSTAGKKATSMISMQAEGAGAGFLLTTDNNVWTDEGFILTPANDANPFNRAFAITNAAGSRVLYRVTKHGSAYFDSTLVSPGYNLIDNETGANNAIAGTFTNQLVPALAMGLCVTVKLNHGLQAGPNTFNFAGTGAKPIKSHYNPTLDISSPYSVGAMISLCYDGANWEDTSQ